ncbi:MAG: hypothetical protein JWM16_6365 [Verrucomicrobiales bacterium]|nr:hypothetical protein [Verrucomicrobiales bacterium]
MLAIDFAAVKAMFGGKLTQPQVDGINSVLAAFNAHGDGSKAHLAYLLATAKHETANTMQPIYERGVRAYFNKYEPDTAIGKRLGNTHPGDGFLFRGRGYVQLTGRANYAKFGLEADPDKALDPATAADVLVTGCLKGIFTGKKLSDYPDFPNMRRVINGTDRADLIATYANSFLRSIA